MTVTISDLPEAIILNSILPLLSVKDTINFGKTNRRHNSLVKTDEIWRQKANELDLLIHDDSTNIYFIVKDILKNFLHYTIRARWRLNLCFDFEKIKPTTDENIKEIANRIDLVKSTSIAVFWDYLLNKLPIIRGYQKSRYRSSCPALIFHPLQYEGFTKIQREFDKWLNENQDEIEKIEKLTTDFSFPLFFPYVVFFPSSIEKFKNLKVLTLNCEMFFLPDSIGNLPKLEELNLDKNHLEPLPNSLGKLKNLKVLSLRNNWLKTLFESIGDLQNLIELHIEKNKLRALPNSINNLTNLEEISLGENYLTTFPEILYKKNLKVDGLHSQKKIPDKKNYPTFFNINFNVFESTKVFGLNFQNTKETTKKIAIPIIVGLAFFFSSQYVLNKRS
jgi:hypothetical protein